MIKFLKTRGSAWLLIGLVLLTTARMLVSFQAGYYGGSNLFLFFCGEPLRYSLIVICAVTILASIGPAKRKIAAGLVLAFLISIGLIQTEQFMTLGAMQSIHDAGPERIRADARALIDELEKPTHFTDETQQRLILDEFVPKEQLPFSLQNEVFNDVLVLDDKVFIEKNGLCCLFRGFIVFKAGSDVWKSEKDIVLLNGCGYCWRIRVLDGLYWYHDVPTEEELSTIFHPLK